MKFLVLFSCLFSLSAAATTTTDQQGAAFLGPIRQLTFVGARTGEGYFSPDGQWITFQAERETDTPFYQIYVMNLKTAEIHKVSPGLGKNTCSWIHPSLKRVLFSSTYLDPQIKTKIAEERQSRQSKVQARYSWSYDEHFDIFATDLTGKGIVRLTRERGYDAEGSYSPDGKWIAFASNRLGYSSKLTADEQKMFQQDPSYMMDIYLMGADGKNVRQLTTERGYDGGPFFSPDGQRIVWRHFSADGKTAEVYTMKIDGTDKKQITRLKAMSWAPFYHPSGDYLIFTTNLHGYENFELYVVDAQGEREPIRVTTREGFDGLPVFTPDGQSLVWTWRNQKGDSQLYQASWNDTLARQLLKLPPHLLRATSVAPEITETDSRALVEYFAAPELKGRATGSPEEETYTKAVAQYFANLGLQPTSGEKNFMQKFSFTSGVKLGEKNSLKAGERTLMVEKDWVPVSFSASGEFTEAPVVFAGYGLNVPATEKFKAYNSYADLDVKGKWVLVLRDVPWEISSELKHHFNMYSRLQHKVTLARNLGAKGVLFISGPNSGAKNLPKLTFEGGHSDSTLPVLALADSAVEGWFAGQKLNLKDLQTRLDRGEQVVGVQFTGLLVSGRVDVLQQSSTGQNVLALLKVPGAKKTLVIGAHSDHLGHGLGGTSLAKGHEKGQIHYGADDNASGVAGVLQLAKHFTHLHATQPKKLKQNILFALWSGEEIGVLGSQNFVKRWRDAHPKAKFSDEYSVGLNMDMIGRYRDSLVVQGVGSAPAWRRYIEKMAATTSLALTTLDDPYLPTDSMTFYLAGIPSINFFTGAHAEYHSPRDLPSSLNYSALAKTIQVVGGLATLVASQPNTDLVYQKVEGNQKNLEGRKFRIYLGTVPDYSQEGAKGVLLSGITQGSPAEKAGMKAHDVIVELAGSKIENLYDYVYVLQVLRPDKETEIAVLRDKQKKVFKITPRLKD